MNGSCLCGGVSFSIEGFVGPFELCHCKRCQKVSGSAFVSALVAESKGFKLISGSELIREFKAPLLLNPPAYIVYFCGTCGSHLPDPHPMGQHMDVPAGLLDDDPVVFPDKHIYVDRKASWDEIADDIPQYTGAQFEKTRFKK